MNQCEYALRIIAYNFKDIDELRENANQNNLSYEEILERAYENIQKVAKDTLEIINEKV